MARLTRLCVAGELHLVSQRGHSGSTVFQADDDYLAYLQGLQQAAAQHGVAIHGYVLLPQSVLMLATPAEANSLGHLLQAVGRRFGADYNRRHARTGALWDGRFRSAIADAHTHLIDCLRYVESAPLAHGMAIDALDYPWSSAPHHGGRRLDPIVTEHAEYWRLGNTPFDREVRYRRLLEEPLAPALQDRIGDALTKGWALGSPAFIKRIEEAAERPAAPRRRGRPPRWVSDGPVAKKSVPN
jgi:putative transposase